MPFKLLFTIVLLYIITPQMAVLASKRNVHFDALPDLVFENILLKLKPQSILNLRETSKRIKTRMDWLDIGPFSIIGSPSQRRKLVKSFEGPLKAVMSQNLKQFRKVDLPVHVYESLGISHLTSPFLIRLNVHVNSKKNSPKTLFQFWLSVKERFPKLFDFQVYHQGSPAIIRAVIDGDKTQVINYLDNGADINTVDGTHQTPVHFAVLRQRIDIVDIFLQRGCDLNIPSSSDIVPLMDAVSTVGDVNLIRKFAEHGANFNHADRHGETVLMKAVSNNRNLTVIIRELLRLGAKIDTADKLGRTALMHAAMKGRLAHTIALLENNAQVDHVDNDGKSALILAIESKGIPRRVHPIPEIVTNLLDFSENTAFHKQNYIKALSTAIDLQKYRIIQSLLMKHEHFGLKINQAMVDELSNAIDDQNFELSENLLRMVLQQSEKNEHIRV